MIWDISLNGYGYHIANIVYTTIMPNGHLDPAFLHTYAKTQPTTISTSCYYQICTINNYSHQIGNICKIFDRFIWMYIHTYMPHMKSLPSTKEQEDLHKYLTYKYHWRVCMATTLKLQLTQWIWYLGIQTWHSKKYMPKYYQLQHQLHIWLPHMFHTQT